MGHGGTTTGISPTRESDTSAITFTCPQKLYPPPSRDSQGLMPDQDQVPPLEASFGDKPADGDRAAYRRAPGTNGDKAGAAGPGSAPLEFRGGFGRGKTE